MRTVHDMKRPNFNQRGFTLVELVFVIAIIVVLASMFLPLAFSKLEKADLTKADVDIQALAAALTSFWEDLRHFPVCSTDDTTADMDCSPLTNSNNNLKVLFTKSDGTTPTAPAVAAGATWTFPTLSAKYSAFNHLVVNNPSTSATTDFDYDSTKWKGPYISRLALDSWGNSYVIAVGAMEKNGAVTNNGAKGWILSAGPDGELNTSATSESLSGDDRGFIFSTAQ